MLHLSMLLVARANGWSAAQGARNVASELLPLMRWMERFLSFADDEVCPALDPQSGACDLYQYRPMTCRVFGPPVRNEGGGLGICELCFHGASDDEIASCEMRPDPEHLEDSLLAELTDSGESGSTIVAYVLAN